MRTPHMALLLAAGGLTLGTLAGMSARPEMVQRHEADWRASLGSNAYDVPIPASYTVHAPDDPMPWGPFGAMPAAYAREAPPVFVPSAMVPLPPLALTEERSSSVVRVHRGGADSASATAPESALAAAPPLPGDAARSEDPAQAAAATARDDTAAPAEPAPAAEAPAA